MYQAVFKALPWTDPPGLATAFGGRVSQEEMEVSG